MPKANDLQFGGDHYKHTAVQPWDYVVYNEIAYLEGTAIKYISRHRRKNGKEDLQKAGHFILKAIETVQASHSPTRRYSNRSYFAQTGKLRIQLSEFTKSQNFTPAERDIVHYLTVWSSVQELQAAYDMIQTLVDNYDSPEVQSETHLIKDSKTGKVEQQKPKRIKTTLLKKKD